MGTRLTSMDEAHEMKAAIDATVDDLERAGFARGQVGAAMIGIGLALMCVHDGQADALRAIDGARDAMLSSNSRN